MLDDILNTGQIWRGQQHAPLLPGISSGFDTLDQALPSCGWPANGITEILTSYPGVGELSLLLPALARISQQQTLAWISPPFMPYGKRLQQSEVQLDKLLIIKPRNTLDAHWSAEETLKSGCCGAVCYWPQKTPDFKTKRRLQMLCQEFQVPLFLFLPNSKEDSTPCSLRLEIKHRDLFNLTLWLSKCQGRWAGEEIQISLPSHAFWRYPLQASAHTSTICSKSGNIKPDSTQPDSFQSNNTQPSSTSLSESP